MSLELCGTLSKKLVYLILDDEGTWESPWFFE